MDFDAPCGFARKDPVDTRNTQPKTNLGNIAADNDPELEVRSRSFFAFNTNCCIKAAIETDGAQSSSGQLLERALDDEIGRAHV